MILYSSRRFVKRSPANTGSNAKNVSNIVKDRRVPGIQDPSHWREVRVRAPENAARLQPSQMR